MCQQESLPNLDVAIPATDLQLLLAVVQLLLHAGPLQLTPCSGLLPATRAAVHGRPRRLLAHLLLGRSKGRDSWTICFSVRRQALTDRPTAVLLLLLLACSGGAACAIGSSLQRCLCCKAGSV